MSAVLYTPPAEALHLEWERLTLLGQCLSGARQGNAPSESQLDRLKTVVAEVNETARKRWREA